MIKKRISGNFQRLSTEDRAEFNTMNIEYNSMVTIFLSVIVAVLLSGSMLVGYISSLTDAESVGEFWLILPYHIACITISIVVFVILLILRKKQMSRHIISDILSITQVCLIMTLFLISAHVEIQVIGIKNINSFIIVMFALGLLLRFRVEVTFILEVVFAAAVIVFLIFEKNEITNFYPSLINIICSFVISTVSAALYWNTRKNYFISTKRLNLLAATDPLTRLNNRRSFDIYFEREWQRARTEKLYIVLYFIDVDYFKKYNDLYGHTQGDICLRTIADTLSSSVRKNDFVARYGGEEFVVLLTSDITNIAQRIAGKMLDTLRKRNIPHGDSIASCVTMSIGCMVHRPDDLETLSISDFIKMADDALYMAKEQGRNRIVFHPEAAK